MACMNRTAFDPATGLRHAVEWIADNHKLFTVCCRPTIAYWALGGEQKLPINLEVVDTPIHLLLDGKQDLVSCLECASRGKL